MAQGFFKTQAHKKVDKGRKGAYGVTYKNEHRDPETQYAVADDEFGGGDISEEVDGAVVVPRMSEGGGIDGSDNPYGAVVPGQVYGKRGPTGPSELDAPFIKKMQENDGKIEKVSEEDLLADLDASSEEFAASVEEMQEQNATQPPAPVEEEYEYEEEEYYEDEELTDEEIISQPGLSPSDIVRIMDERDAKKEREAQAKLDKIQAKKRSEEARKRKEEEAKMQEVVTKDNGKRTRIRLSSSRFGTSDSKCRHVVDNPGVVGVVRHVDDDSFCPPPSQDPFTISWQDKEYSVYFAGLVIDLDFCDMTMQVFFKSK
jgi:hypothetical protein